MHDLATGGLHDGFVDADATVRIPVAAAVGVVVDPAALRTGGRGPPRHDTPSMHTSLPLTGAAAHATLTVLTGVRAGQITTIEGAAMTIGRAADADLVVDHAGVSRHHVRITPMARGGFCLEDLASTNGTFVGAARVGVAVLNRDDLLQLGPQFRIRFAIVDPVEESLRRQLYESSVRDPLTHAFNRRYFAERLQAEVSRERRSEGDLAVLMIDVDSLRQVNDGFGHLAGDRALRSVASRIQPMLRGEDVLARYGGDEFVVLATGTDPADARQLAERIRRAVEGLHLEANGQDVPITASIGVASLTELATTSEPVAALLAVADARMYEAKASGRNRVCTTTGPSSGPSASDR